jgi:thioredoxin reductase
MIITFDRLTNETLTSLIHLCWHFANDRYKDLWCRSPKEVMEYPDYTWDDHFGKPAPSFLPRRDVLEYMVKRNDAEGTLGHVNFSHSVEKVSLENDHFNVSVRDLESGKVEQSRFDRVIYAGGVHNEAERPPELLEIVQEFEGKILHSSECNDNFEADVKDKHVFVVGDAGSGEDTALRAVKLGAKKVTVSSRMGNGEAYATSSWPEGKVKVIYGPPYKLTKGKDFKCHAVYWNDKRQAYKKDDEEETFKVKSVDTLVLCTGYDYDMDAIDSDIRMDIEGQWQQSKGWTMDNNSLTITVGNVKPSKAIDPGYSVYPDVYRGVLISNPHMFYLVESSGDETPLITLDVNAWLVLGYLTGEVPIPKTKEMEKLNQKQLEAELQIPFIRADIDGAYREEMDEIDKNHWSENAEDERTLKLERQSPEFLIGCLAR